VFGELDEFGRRERVGLIDKFLSGRSLILRVRRELTEDSTYRIDGGIRTENPVEF
jgi:hypothetical protein